jgi:cytochrome c553
MDVKMKITEHMPRPATAIALLLIAFCSVADVHAKADYHGIPLGAAAAKQGSALIAVCAACHGITGNSAAAEYPNLAAQRYNYLLKQLEDFRDGARKSTIMSGMAMTIPPSANNQNLKEIAAYFSRQPLVPAEVAAGSGVRADATQLKEGQKIYTQGLANDNIPACAACHGLGADGNGPMAIPALALQHQVYLLTQLDQFASGARRNSPGQVMTSIARAMTKPQMQAVAAYLQQLNPDSTLGIGPKNYDEYTRTVELHQQAEKSALVAAPHSVAKPQAETVQSKPIR